MKKKNKVLLLTYAFPPNKAAESYLCVKALARTNLLVDVVTINPSNLNLPLDGSLNGFIKKYFNNIYTINYKNWLTRNIFSLLRFLHFFPDRFQIFNKSVIHNTEKLNLDTYDVIISWSQWHSIHLAALKLKKKYPHIKWILHMSDPWKDNPFLEKIPFYYLIQSNLEKKAFEYADNLNFTSKETVNLIFKKYPLKYKLKSSIIPHSFETELFKINKKINEKILIRYLGNFYGPRNPKHFCLSLKKIQNENKNLLKNFKFEFYGNWIGNSNWSPQDIGLNKDLIQFFKPLSYLDSLELMSTSDFLLIIDAPFKKSVFFPSKLVDYIGSKKPIIAITPPGTSYNILEKNNAIIINPLESVELEKSIKNALNLILNNKVNYLKDYYQNTYSSNAVGNQFEKIIRYNKTNYLPNVLHLVPTDGYGGVEIAAKYAKNINSNKFKFNIGYIYDQQISTQNYSFAFNPFKIINSAIQINKNIPDIIILSLWRSVLIGLILKIFKRNISLILFIHSETDSHWFDKLLTFLGAIFSDEIWADSESTMEKRLQYYKIEKRKNIITFLPRNLKRIVDAYHKPMANFIYWGRIGNEKQIDFSIQIFSKILTFYPNAIFRIIGPDGGSKTYLKNLIKKLKITKSIIWYDEQNIDKIIELAKKSSFYIQASKFEGMAVSVAEAMQLGLVPIVTNVGEIRKYCEDGKNSIIIKDFDTTVSRIKSIIRSQKDFAKLSYNATNAWKNKGNYKDSIEKNIKDFINFTLKKNEKSVL